MFAEWLSSDWRGTRVSSEGAADGMESIELVDSLRPWVEDACSIVGPELGRLSCPDALALHDLFDRALDDLQRLRGGRTESSSEDLLLLHPLDDLLAALHLTYSQSPSGFAGAVAGA